MSTLTSDEDILNAELNAKQAQLASLNKDLEDLRAKRDRVTKQVLYPSVVSCDIVDQHPTYSLTDIQTEPGDARQTKGVWS